MNTHNLCFVSVFVSENFQFLVVKFSIYLNSCVFVMIRKYLNALCRVGYPPNCLDDHFKRHLTETAISAKVSFNPFMPSELFFRSSWTDTFQIAGCLVNLYFYYIWKKFL